MDVQEKTAWTHQIVEWVAATFAAIFLWVVSYVRKKFRRVDTLEQNFVTTIDFEKYCMSRQDRDTTVDEKLDGIREAIIAGLRGIHERVDRLNDRRGDR